MFSHPETKANRLIKTMAERFNYTRGDILPLMQLEKKNHFK